MASLQATGCCGRRSDVSDRVARRDRGRVPSVPRRLAPITAAERIEIEDLIEVQAPEAGTTRYPYVTLQWARQWPSEEIWKARRRAV